MNGTRIFKANKTLSDDEDIKLEAVLGAHWHDDELGYRDSTVPRPLKTSRLGTVAKGIDWSR